MKPWQVIAIVLVAVVGVALVVYFATRQNAPADDSAGIAGAQGTPSAADTVSGIGSGLTGFAAAVARAVS